MDWTDFWAVLSWVIYGGGAGTLAYLLMEKIKWSASVGSEKKRYISIVITIGFALLAWGVLLLAKAVPTPVGLINWWVEAWKIGGVAYIASSLEHGRLVLRAKDTEAANEATAQTLPNEDTDSKCDS